MALWLWVGLFRVSEFRDDIRPMIGIRRAIVGEGNAIGDPLESLPEESTHFPSRAHDRDGLED